MKHLILFISSTFFLNFVHANIDSAGGPSYWYSKIVLEIGFNTEASPEQHYVQEIPRKVEGYTLFSRNSWKTVPDLFCEASSVGFSCEDNLYHKYPYSQRGLSDYSPSNFEFLGTFAFDDVKFETDDFEYGISCFKTKNLSSPNEEIFGCYDENGKRIYVQDAPDPSRSYKSVAFDRTFCSINKLTHKFDCFGFTRNSSYKSTTPLSENRLVLAKNYRANLIEETFNKLFQGIAINDFYLIYYEHGVSYAEGCVVDVKGSLYCISNSLNKQDSVVSKIDGLTVISQLFGNNFFKCGASNLGLFCFENINPINHKPHQQLKIFSNSNFNENTKIVLHDKAQFNFNRSFCALSNEKLDCFNIDSGERIDLPVALTNKKIKDIIYHKSGFCASYQADSGLWYEKACWRHPGESSLAGDFYIEENLRHVGFSKFFHEFENSNQPVSIDTQTLIRGLCINNLNYKGSNLYNYVLGPTSIKSATLLFLEFME